MELPPNTIFFFLKPSRHAHVDDYFYYPGRMHRVAQAQVGDSPGRLSQNPCPNGPFYPFIPFPARPSGDGAAPPAPTPTRLPGTVAPRGSQGTEAPPVLGCAQQVPHCPGHSGRQECHIPAPAGLTTGTALRPHKDVQDQVTKAPVTKHSAATAATGYPRCPAEVLAKIMRRKKKTQLTAFIGDLDLLAWRNAWKGRAKQWRARISRHWTSSSPLVSARP